MLKIINSIMKVCKFVEFIFLNMAMVCSWSGAFIEIWHIKFKI